MNKIYLFLAMALSFSGHAVLAADGAMKSDMKGGTMKMQSSKDGMAQKDDAMMKHDRAGKKKGQHKRHDTSMAKQPSAMKPMDKNSTGKGTMDKM